MMTAMPPLPIAPLPGLEIAQPAIEPAASFGAVLAVAVQGPIIADNDAPTDPAADLPQKISSANVERATNEHLSITNPETSQPPVAEAVNAAPAPEYMVAAQIIAVADQVASRSANPATADEMPHENRITARSGQTDAPVRQISVTVALADQKQAETTMIETGLAAQSSPGPTPQHRPAEPAVFILPPIAAPANARPQMFHELDLARDLAWIGNLAQDIVAASNDRDQLSFRLMPRLLGQLDVEISHSPGGLRVEMTATTERATQIIAAEQPRLIEELRQSGIKMVGNDLAAGQHPGSQRGHAPPRTDLPFTAFDGQTQSAKTANRPDGRFA